MVMMENRTPEFLTVDQVANQLQISRPSVYALFKSGKLKPIKVNSNTRVRASELLNLR